MQTRNDFSHLSRLGPHLGRSPRLLSLVTRLGSSLSAPLSVASGRFSWQDEELWLASIGAAPGASLGEKEGGRSETWASASMFQSESNPKLGNFENLCPCWCSSSGTIKLIDSCNCSLSPAKHMNVQLAQIQPQNFAKLAKIPEITTHKAYMVGL